MSRTPEGKIKDKVRAMLKAHKVWYFLPGNNGYGKSGIPDFVGCVGGRFFGIECKADASKKPTELQLKCAADITKAGGRWFLVCDDESLDEAEAFIAIQSVRIEPYKNIL
jgi:hypothetical protein